ncbi:FUSC family protein [Paludibacterium paludis]|nr:FUSC family protein [Paludibacterium paludis]
MKQPAWRHPRFRYEHAGIIHVIRLSAAILVSQIIAATLHESHAVWMSVTIIVVMGALPHTGSIIAKARQRAVGTTIGALAGIGVILVGRHSPWLAEALIVALTALAACKAIGKAGYTALAAAITLAIVAMSGSLEDGAWRFLYVIAGVGISVVFALLIPARAREHWYFLLSDNIRDMAFLFRRANRGEGPEMGITDAVIKRIVIQRGLLSAAANESGLDAPSLHDIMRRQRAILNTIELMAGQDVEEGAVSVKVADARQAEASVALHFARLGAKVGLTIVGFGNEYGQTDSPQKCWLLGCLARQLEGLDAAMDSVTPALAGRRAR